MPTFDLLFLKRQKGGGFAGPPIAHVFLKSWLTHTYRGAPNDLQLITAQAVGVHEFNYEIDRLIGELEKIRQRAKQKFHSATRK